VKHWQIALAILAVLSASFAIAEDFKTVNGKEYKDATVSRVEPDGIILKSKSGIAKVYFVELPKEVQKRFCYDPAAAAAQRQSAGQAEQPIAPTVANRETMRSEIARGLREMYPVLKRHDTELLQLEAHTNEVIARNKAANTDSDGFMIGARLGQMWDLSLLLEFFEDNEPNSVQTSQARQSLEGYASDIRRREKELAINDDLVVQAAEPDPRDHKYRAELKELILKYAPAE
jgi:hypothetical protein